MGAAGKRSWEVLLRVALFGVVAAGVASCTALPPGSLDPLVPVLGLPRVEKGPAQPRNEAPAPAGASGARRIPGGEGDSATRGPLIVE